MYTTVVAARLTIDGNVPKPFSAPRTINSIIVATLSCSCPPHYVPHTHGYHRYLRTLFAISIDRKIDSQQQSYASVLGKRTSLVNIMAPDQESSRGIVTGVMRQAPPKRLSIAMATPRMFAPDPFTRASLASSVLGTGTAGAGAEMSPPISGWYLHGEVDGGNGRSILIKKRPGFARSADTTRVDGVRPTLNPSLGSNDVSCLLTLAQGRKT